MKLTLQLLVNQCPFSIIFLILNISQLCIHTTFVAFCLSCFIYHSVLRVHVPKVTHIRTLFSFMTNIHCLYMIHHAICYTAIRNHDAVKIGIQIPLYTLLYSSCGYIYGSQKLVDCLMILCLAFWGAAKLLQKLHHFTTLCLLLGNIPFLPQWPFAMCFVEISESPELLRFHFEVFYSVDPKLNTQWIFRLTNGLVSEGACSWVWQPEFDIWDPIVRREFISASCLQNAICILCYKPTCTHKMNKK